MRRIARLATVSLVLLMTASVPALAGSGSTNFGVTATVVPNCAIAASTLAFGGYDPIVAHAASNLDASGSVTITCTRGAVTTVDLGLGSHASGSVRRMTNGSDFLQYEIFQDSGRTTVWGTGASSLDTGTAPSKASRTFTIFGRVPSGQDVSVGGYTDTVTAVVNF